MLPLRWLILGMCIAAFCTHADAAASSQLPLPMRDAVDTYAYEYATYQEWTYVDRLASAHGTWKVGWFTLVFLIPQRDPDVHFEMHVEARVTRCGPGWYVVSVPLDVRRCREPKLLPDWNYTKET